MAKKIMIVDDEAAIVHMVLRRLVENHYQVCAAYEGFEAVTVAHNEKPDLILLDYKMPAGSGLSVFQGLKSSSVTAHIPVIFMTAYPFDDVRKKALEMGAVDYVMKPFETVELLEKIKKVLGE